MDTRSGRAPRPKTSPASRHAALLEAAPDDVRAPAFQTFLNAFFGHKTRARPPASNPLEGEGNRCVRPNGGSGASGSSPRSRPKLSLHQNAVATVMRVLAHKPGNGNRGLLAWHSTGSGKTCTATAVMDAFWETDRRIVYVSSNEALNSNPPVAFHKCALQFMRRFRDGLHGSHAQRLEAVGRAFAARGVTFISFARLAHYLLLYKPLKAIGNKREEHLNFLNDAVVIIDEVQNIFKPLPNQRGESAALRRFFLTPRNRRLTNTKMVILTATPGDTPDDLVRLLNMVRDDDGRPPIAAPADTEDAAQMEAFKDRVRGLVSYFDMSGDDTKFPVVTDNHAVRAPMRDGQFRAYLERVQKETPASFEALLKQGRAGKYREAARKYSNMLYARAVAGPGARVRGSSSSSRGSSGPVPMQVDTPPLDDALAEFSAKLPQLLAVLDQYPNDKHYVYSSFYTKHGFGGQGIVAIAKVLEEARGFEELKPKSKLLNQEMEDIAPQRRFVLATSKNLAGGASSAGAAGKNLRRLLRVFNDPANQDGSRVQVFLASQGYNEGVDLKDVKHVHLFEPLLTLAADRQAVGRAARYCSHASLDRAGGEWTVQVHRYYSDAPADLALYQAGPLMAQRDRLQEDAAGAGRELEALKGKRGVAEERAELQGRLKRARAELKAVEAKIQDAQKLSLDNLVMVDDAIAQEARARGQVLQRLYQAVFESAVDCQLFQDFHNRTRPAAEAIRCDALPALPSAQARAGALAAAKRARLARRLGRVAGVKPKKVRVKRPSKGARARPTAAPVGSPQAQPQVEAPKAQAQTPKAQAQVATPGPAPAPAPSPIQGAPQFRSRTQAQAQTQALSPQAVARAQARALVQAQARREIEAAQAKGQALVQAARQKARQQAQQAKPQQTKVQQAQAAQVKPQQAKVQQVQATPQQAQAKAKQVQQTPKQTKVQQAQAAQAKPPQQAKVQQAQAAQAKPPQQTKVQQAKPQPKQNAPAA
jgi:hypothetical protein